MKVLCVDHIGIAVKSLDASVMIYKEMGLEPTGFETIDEQKVKTAFIPVGESEVELLESTAPDGPIGKFIEKRGEGLHHISLRVDDIEAALAELKEKRIRLIDEKPRYGAGGARIAFIHPKATNGILLELSQRRCSDSKTKK
jgi:methylmalonyl-CoA/ethylmalonyl-CoA epimerase